jgi:hypothetical protein
MAGGLMFKEGEECFVSFHDLHWFEAEKLKEGMVDLVIGEVRV